MLNRDQTRRYWVRPGPGLREQTRLIAPVVAASPLTDSRRPARKPGELQFAIEKTLRVPPPLKTRTSTCPHRAGTANARPHQHLAISYLFNPASQFITTVIAVGGAFSLCMFTRNRFPSRLGT